MRDFADMAGQLETHNAEFPRNRADRLPTAFVWRDPSTIPPRPWLYGHHLIRKQVSVTVAPGGVGKSSLTICEALAMASGRELLGDWTASGLKVWIYNLEDTRDELERRIIAAMQHHAVAPEEVNGRLYVDTGRERALSTASQTRDGIQIIEPEMEALAQEIVAREIDVLVIDPFVSSHQVSENDNGAIDLVAKEWARLADHCNCAIELVHHTRKTNGEEATTESARGATALLGAF
jgi:RecA-family ATPase